ncbi:hypothetical protein BSKO_00490 [Bryopsis sp. KO-2023]|nr:hypothetical protein BSKO_00490 [Bryopsis sp. KO-2023]
MTEEKHVERRECEGKIDRSLQRNIFVKFMIDKLDKAGCEIPRSFFVAEECGVEVGGGFVPGRGITICHNHLTEQGEIDRCLVHELVHAYDHCRANIDWSNCEHHACSEIRAATLSGDCDLWQEFFRGNWKLKGQFQNCVKRRAELSVRMNPSCSEITAKAAVDSVFEKCFKDTAPFDRIP